MSLIFSKRFPKFESSVYLIFKIRIYNLSILEPSDIKLNQVLYKTSIVFKMAVVLSNENFLATFGRTCQYWDITDNLSTDDIKKLRQKVPDNHQFISAYVLRDRNPAWKNYVNTEVTYLRAEHASPYHAGASQRPILSMQGWFIIHPVGDIYVVYI